MVVPGSHMECLPAVVLDSDAALLGGRRMVSDSDAVLLGGRRMVGTAKTGEAHAQELLVVVPGSHMECVPAVVAKVVFSDSDAEFGLLLVAAHQAEVSDWD